MTHLIRFKQTGQATLSDENVLPIYGTLSSAFECSAFARSETVELSGGADYYEKS